MTMSAARPAGFVCQMEARHFFGTKQQMQQVKDNNDNNDYYDEASSRRFVGEQQKTQVKDQRDDDKNRFSKEEYRRFLDRVMDKTTKMESSMESLKEQAAASRNNASTGSTMCASEMDALFQEQKKHKQDVSQELSEIQSLLRGFAGTAGGNTKLYAVDAPDGDCDGHVLEELEEVAHIIEDESAAATKKNTNPPGAHKLKAKEEVLKQRAGDPEHW
jgi:hypothetical protein